MESKIFNAIDNDDVEGLKLLMDYPNIFQIEDINGYTILQNAISDKSFAVFDYLLSLDHCPINAPNSKGKTPLQVALIDPHFGKDEHFTCSLLHKGANIDCIGDTEILCVALRCGWIDIAQYLVEEGVDLNCYCDGEYFETPLHILNKLGSDNEIMEDLLDDLDDLLEDLIPMMLYFGADPLIPDYEGFKPIDYAFSNEFIAEEIKEHLVFYVFDDYCTSYEIPIRSLFDLITSDLPFTPQVLKHVTSVYVNDNDFQCTSGCLVSDLFQMKVEYLKWLLDKFDYVIESVIEVCLERHGSCVTAFEYWKHTRIENFYLLLQNEFSSYLIQLINKTPVIKYMIEWGDTPRSELFDLILVALSYGAILYDTDLEVLYETWGDCEFFRILLHMDIKVDNKNRKLIGIMPGLLYDIHLDIETFSSDRGKYECSQKAVKRLINYFADPRLKSYSRRRSKKIRAIVKNLPSVPLLVELARNEARKYLIKKYKIENSMQFYTLIKHLPISTVYQKIITLETKLY